MELIEGNSWKSTLFFIKITRKAFRKIDVIRCVSNNGENSIFLNSLENTNFRNYEMEKGEKFRAGEEEKNHGKKFFFFVVYRTNRLDNFPSYTQKVAANIHKVSNSKNKNSSSQPKCIRVYIGEKLGYAHSMCVTLFI